MREVITMWRDVRMVSLAIVIAALYTAGLIPSKGLVIVPGFTEIRPAGVIPVAFSLLFGPAAAWGSAFGNLLSDAFGGTLSAGSLFGFVGNFWLGFIGYKLWGNLAPLSSGEKPTMRSVRAVLEYLVIALTAAAGTAAIIAWGLDLLGLFPFSVFAAIVFANDFLAAAILGPPLLYLAYEPADRVGLTYDAIMGFDAAEDGGSGPRWSPWAVVAIPVVWLVLGIAVSVGFEGVPLGAIPRVDIKSGTGGSPVQIALGVVAFLALLGSCACTRERLSSL